MFAASPVPLVPIFFIHFFTIKPTWEAILLASKRVQLMFDNEEVWAVLCSLCLAINSHEFCWSEGSKKFEEGWRELREHCLEFVREKILLKSIHNLTKTTQWNFMWSCLKLQLTKTLTCSSHSTFHCSLDTTYQTTKKLPYSSAILPARRIFDLEGSF